MGYVTFELTNNSDIPAIVCSGSSKTPVWIQQHWKQGEFASCIQNNGCGHCCAAMALNLHSVEIDPYEEYMLCRKLWGEPVYPQENFMSVAGASKMLNHLGVSAKPYASVDKYEAIKNITDALDEGKMVIFSVGPYDANPGHPFSKGSHWVLAAGYDATGKIVVANSSLRAITQDGIQVVEPEIIRDSLYVSERLDESRTWGIQLPRTLAGGYVIVG